MIGQTSRTNWRTLENVAVECTHCNARMEMHAGGGGEVRYFRCTRCSRWVTSMYAADALRADVKMRTRPLRNPGEQLVSESTRSKLERFLGALDAADPYRTLGMSPNAEPAQLRARYRELALAAHPDRGGSAERMQELNAAWERVQAHQARRHAQSVTRPVRAVALAAVSP
ncbi:MAG TPA: J domain-containing protein [Myxococcaceae bacterium]|nr:J domain-containing protein [Myxococcaceae bacterium]